MPLRKPIGVKRMIEAIQNYKRICRHWRQSVAVGRYCITCSAEIDGQIASPPPDFGVYLSIGWQMRLARDFYTNGGYVRRVLAQQPYRAMFVDWADFGTIKVKLLAEIVEIILTKIRQYKTVDIGCQAGHGRTGTLLAALIMRIEHVGAKGGLARARRRYCQHACEHYCQERLLEDYEVYLRTGKYPPAPPKENKKRNDKWEVSYAYGLF